MAAEHSALSSSFPVEMPAPGSSFMDALLSQAVPSLDKHDNKMLTENGDLAFRSSGNGLVDLFFELEDVVSGARLKEVLANAWAENPDATLRIIWNARSIHLGKGSRNTFYRALGWLAETRPKTLLANLPWLVRPIIKKKAPKKDKSSEKTESATADAKDDAVMVDAELSDDDFDIIDADEGEAGEKVPSKQPQSVKDDNELSEFDVKYGCAHGYWKDLLNILSLAANDELKADGDPRKIFNIDNRTSKKRTRDWTKGHKKTVLAERHERVDKKLREDEFYKSLHFTVAQLFVDQLKLDKLRLASPSKADKKHITLAAKWAPSAEGSHDSQTFIVSTIAEMLHPFDSACPEGVDPADRKTYLKHARIAYQSKTLSPLRKFLRVVERDITAEKFENIMYERVTSLAMKRYTSLFIRKDHDRFEKYIDGVADGKMRISGATLLPSTLVAAVSGSRHAGARLKGVNAMVQNRVADKEHVLTMKTIDGQWKTLVQRIKDSGSLESSIAVCDVSGSMSGPRFSDGTCPMDSSIGLSLLLAEVTQPPFGGAFITFSDVPEVVKVGGGGDQRTFAEKVNYIRGANWSMNTNFTAVFEDLLLPMALEHNINKEDMVKQVFVFSDMQFDAADQDSGAWRYDYGARRASPARNQSWKTSYERIKQKYEEAGYGMPRLIFWNLAGGRAGYEGQAGEETAPKPVQAHEENTALVSGYSQGQLKMFLDNGTFEDPEAEETVEEMETEDGDVIVQKKSEKAKTDSLDVVKRAVSHEAYRMLMVLD